MRLPESALPFVGELIAVRAEEAEWEGAAERLLHGFALSILVPDEHYAAASEWVNDAPPGRHARLLPGAGLARRPGDRPAGDGQLYGKLDIKETEFTGWLERETGQPRPTYECVETMADFRRLPRAITKAGRSRGPTAGTRRTTGAGSMTGPATYSAGPTSERSWPCCGAATVIQDKLNTLAAAAKRLKEEAGRPASAGRCWRRSARRPISTEIDWQPLVNQIEDLKARNATSRRALPS